MADDDLNVFCPNGVDGLPKLSFYFQGQPFDILPDQYLLGNNQASFYFGEYTSMIHTRSWIDYAPVFHGFKICICQIGIQPLLLEVSSNAEVIILGDVFLRSIYTVFDMDGKQVI